MCFIKGEHSLSLHLPFKKYSDRMSLEIGDTTNVMVSAFTSYFQWSQENYTAAQEDLKYDHFYFSKRTLLSWHLWLSHREKRITVSTHLMHLLVNFDCLYWNRPHIVNFFHKKTTHLTSQHFAHFVLNRKFQRNKVKPFKILYLLM